MKKLVLMAAALLMTVAANAQKEVGTFSISPRVGINVANMTGDTDGAKARVRFAAGVEGMYMAHDIIGVSLGLMYSQQGAKNKENGVEGSVSLDYLNIPVLCNVYVVKGLAVKLGIQPGFCVNKKMKASANGAGYEVSASDMYKGFDFSIPIGVSYEFSNIVIDARYNWGVSNVAKNYNISTGMGQLVSTDIKARNSVFQFTLGYRF